MTLNGHDSMANSIYFSYNGKLMIKLHWRCIYLYMYSLFSLTLNSCTMFGKLINFLKPPQLFHLFSCSSTLGTKIKRIGKISNYLILLLHKCSFPLLYPFHIITENHSPISSCFSIHIKPSFDETN